MICKLFNKLLPLLLLPLLLPSSMLAQTQMRPAIAVSACAGQSLTTGTFAYLTVLNTGVLCTNSTGGGGGAIEGMGTAGAPAGGILTVQGVSSMTALLTDNSELPAAAALADTTANPTVSGIGAYLMCWNTSTWDRCKSSTGGSGTVDANTTRVSIATDDAAFNPLSGCYLVSAASTNATNCKNAAGRVYHIRFINTTSTLYYLRLYNTSSTPTCSSATGFIESIPIPHASGAGAGLSDEIRLGVTYSTGISFCFTGGSSSTDNTNAATGVFGAIFYK